MSGDKITDFFGGPASRPYIEGGRDIGNGAYDFKAYDHPRQWIVVVPDGVTKVALWKAVSTVNHPHPSTEPGSTPVVATVHDNVAAFVAPPTLTGPLDVTGIGQEIWYGRGGKVVKRIDNASSCGPPLGACA